MYSETYAAASKALTVSGDNSGLTPDSNLLVWMVYDFHSCLTLIRKDGSWESGLLMSDTSVLNAFSEDYVTKMLRDFFITDTEVTMIK